MNTAFPQVLALVALDDRDVPVLEAVRTLGAVDAWQRAYVVHVVERARGPGSRLLASPSTPSRPPALDGLIADLDAAFPGREVVGLHLVGRAVEEIARINEREGCDLVVLGRSPPASGRPAWGDHGLRILRLADAPVLVVPEGTRLQLRTVAVGMDLSDHAFAALEVAMRLSTGVRAVAVVDRAGEGLDEDGFAELQQRLHAEYRARGGARFHRQDLPPLDVLDAPSPADGLLGLDPAPDLLVLGSRGLTPLAAVLLGSTAERLGGRCRGPLLVWRARGEQRGLWSALFGGAPRANG